jgi:protein-S-isoprenylcysteine O-methyltransferase Ste14
MRMLSWLSWIELMICWFAWGYPFIVRAPHYQRRESISLTAPTLAGLAFEGIAIVIAFAFRLTPASPPGLARAAASMVLGAVAAVLAWTSVTHLGRQFRIRAGLYHDHALVRTGPYAVVRHPIYASLLAMLLSTLLILTPWKWALVSIVLFVLGTEIRVQTEDRLLASRFGEEFAGYRKKVPAYVPFVR